MNKGPSVKGDGNEMRPPGKTDSNLDSVPNAYVALHRIPALTKEIPFPGGSPARIWFNVVDVIEVGLQHFVSELIQEWVGKELDTMEKEKAQLIHLVMKHNELTGGSRLSVSRCFAPNGGSCWRNQRPLHRSQDSLQYHGRRCQRHWLPYPKE